MCANGVREKVCVVELASVIRIVECGECGKAREKQRGKKKLCVWTGDRSWEVSQKKNIDVARNTWAVILAFCVYVCVCCVCVCVCVCVCCVCGVCRVW